MFGLTVVYTQWSTLRPKEDDMDLNKSPDPTTESPATEPPTTETVVATADPQEALRWAAAAHLSVLVGLVGIPGLLGPLVIWLVKKGENEFVDAQAKEALNFSLSLAIYIVALVGFIVIVSVNESVTATVLFSLTLVATFTASLILPIVAGVRAANGNSYRYPLTLRLVK